MTNNFCGQIKLPIQGENQRLTILPGAVPPGWNNTGLQPEPNHATKWQHQSPMARWQTMPQIFSNHSLPFRKSIVFGKLNMSKLPIQGENQYLNILPGSMPPGWNNTGLQPKPHHATKWQHQDHLKTWSTKHSNHPHPFLKSIFCRKLNIGKLPFQGESQTLTILPGAMPPGWNNTGLQPAPDHATKWQLNSAQGNALGIWPSYTKRPRRAA